MRRHILNAARGRRDSLGVPSECGNNHGLAKQAAHQCHCVGWWPNAILIRAGMLMAEVNRCGNMFAWYSHCSDLCLNWLSRKHFTQLEPVRELLKSMDHVLN